ncbi:MAG: hypothetical protein C0625_01480 [Arcobacter sp.]|nr:MAG: hypothetical protein C0625_01480 [Arcobacter sp.]
MITIPKILDNPENPNFNLEDDEIYSLKEAKELILLERYSYSLFAIWTSVVINIQRRLENFGIANFLNIIEKEETFNKEGNNLKDRWLNINEFNLINYAKKINIINHVTHDLLTTLYWMKSNTNEEETKAINKEEVFALLFLIEKNLFVKPFKIDKRNRNTFPENNSNLKRRKKDKEELINSYRNTHHELLLKSGVKSFNENSKENDIKTNLLNTYI